MAQELITITSEELESSYRVLTPSQSGFTQDLMASNVILPTVDLTRAAQGSETRQDLQTAWDFSTGLDAVINTTSTLISTAGFYKVDLNWVGYVGTTRSASVQINDGSTTKKVWEISVPTVSASTLAISTEDSFIVFLRSTDSLTATSNNAESILRIWYRQIADVNGGLVDPLGFTPQ